MLGLVVLLLLLSGDLLLIDLLLPVHVGYSLAGRSLDSHFVLDGPLLIGLLSRVVRS